MSLQCLRLGDAQCVNDAGLRTWCFVHRTAHQGSGTTRPRLVDTPYREGRRHVIGVMSTRLGRVAQELGERWR